MNHTFCASQASDASRLGTNVENYGSLEPRNLNNYNLSYQILMAYQLVAYHYMCPFRIYFVVNTM